MMGAACDTLTPEQLVEANMGLAGYWTQQVSRRGLLPGETLNDLYADALVGLWEAAQAYTAARGVTFATFSGRRVAGAIKDGRRQRDPLSRGARRANVEAPLSLDAGDSARLADVIADPRDAYAERDDQRERADRLAAVRAAAESLAPAQRLVILGRLDGATLAALGERMGLTEARVWQIQTRAVEHLRRMVA